jgi:(4-(4-[2-(gamma-L-glutamylamino)ethyl]phenoxymethyl)furan-2-yl)methanamine synthase
MAHVILGLDIGGANLKAATADRRAVSVPFPLWKHPEQLPEALAALVGQFRPIDEFAITMTGELCDCFETLEAGVAAIVNAVQVISQNKPVRFWSTDWQFRDAASAKQHWREVAAANWHALATFCGRFAPTHDALLIDIGSTTTDIIPLASGVPSTLGTTDFQRLEFCELVYTGVKRTPVFAVIQDRVCAEYFADMRDVYLVLGLRPEAQHETDTADGRPATVEAALARLARMRGGDRSMIPDDQLISFAVLCHRRQRDAIVNGVRNVLYAQKPSGVPPELRTVIVSGSGEFLAQRVLAAVFPDRTAIKIVSLAEQLGPAVAESAPAFAVAVLAQEQPL